MDDAMNMSLRKFLKRLGVTGQQAIEAAVRDAQAAGKVPADTKLKVSATIRIEAVDLTHTVDGEIETDAQQ